MEKKGNVEEEIFNCPFCNLEPLRLGFDESREKYNIDYDQVTLHCPGCGVDMKELRKDDELIIFAYYDDIEMARYIRKLLSENNWNSQKIHEYEESFNKNFKKTKYFYDKTDFIKS